MDGEHNIVELNWVESTRESAEIFFLDVRDPVERRIENCVERVTQQVERQEIKVQPNDRLSLEVDEDLRVEGDWPGGKVNPTDDERYENDCRRVCDDDANKQVWIVDNSARRCIASDFHMSGVFAEKADDLRPTVGYVCGNWESTRRDDEQVMMIFEKVDS